ncbi:MAG TPA: glutamate-1-semialdehyde 2,1-aminomutase [Firmicutes bacterium]|nr:glutamate-1-semialdehyde 2,1-aminomutase [Bacillota bacterium]
MNHEKSKAAFAKACEVIPGGVNSPVRAFQSVGGEPIFVDHAKGSHIVDIDGNEYIDYICSWGPFVLGHSHPMMAEGALEAIQRGISYGLPTEIETRMAELICSAYKSAEMVRMVNSGTEATMSAIRAARGYTGKDKIIKFEGCYHGHSDCLLVKSGSGALTFGMPTSPGVPADVVKNTLVCRYNDLVSVKETVEANQGEIAAIILEPIAGNMGVIPPRPGFLEGLRTLCTEQGIVLIFDEVISGFRAAFGGASELYGVDPDMVCFGKIIGSGLPVGAYAGKREIMSVISPKGPVYQAGTLSGNPLAMFMGLKLLAYLKEHREIYQRVEEYAAKLEAGMRDLLTKHGLRYQINRVGSLLCLFFTEQEVISYDDVKTCDTTKFSKYFQCMLGRGILLAPSQFEAMFVSAAHTQEDLEKTLHAMDQALSACEE